MERAISDWEILLNILMEKNRTPIGSSEKKKSYLASNKCK